MKVTEYIVKYLESRGVTDVFGYPGGMVTHLIDSFDASESQIEVHTSYHEQASAFSACGYVQASGRPSVAFATSGPGATNLLTGVCNAYFDSIPVLFITGQVNTFEQKGSLGVRQRGFQETDIVSICSGVTKKAVRVVSPEQLPGILDDAFESMMKGRPGPVLLDIPMDVQRAEVNNAVPSLSIAISSVSDSDIDLSELTIILGAAQKPCVLCGMGVRSAGAEGKLLRFLEATGYPLITSMLAVDCAAGYPSRYGFIGAYGSRAANFIAAKADVILSLGTRLDIRQVGAKRENFAPEAQIIRIDIDPGELEYKVHSDEVSYCLDVGDFLDRCNEGLDSFPRVDSAWSDVCETIRGELSEVDEDTPRKIMRAISEQVSSEALVVTDVGQNQVWAAQAFAVKKGQRMLFSGGHGAMGYALPAAIGAYYATKKPIVCLVGDGGMQMNIQELAYIAREHLPITVIVLNNHSLGMIRHFQEMYFDSRFNETVIGCGWQDPDYKAIAQAYGIPAATVKATELSVSRYSFTVDEKSGPLVVNLVIDEPTYVSPKLEFGKPNQDQEPLIERELFNRLMEL